MIISYVQKAYFTMKSLIKGLYKTYKYKYRGISINYMQKVYFTMKSIIKYTIFLNSIAEQHTKLYIRVLISVK